MDFALVVLWAMAGWCGSEPWRWRWPRGPFPPPPDPDPEPWWLVAVIGVIAGVVGGVVFQQVFGPDANRVEMAAASTVGAFLTARVAGSVYALATRRLRGAAPGSAGLRQGS